MSSRTPLKLGWNRLEALIDASVNCHCVTVDGVGTAGTTVLKAVYHARDRIEHGVESILAHLLDRRRRRPVVEVDAVRRYHHARSVAALLAVHKNWRVG